MSNKSAISGSLHRTSKLLGPYIQAVDSVRSRGGRLEGPHEAKSLLDVLVPLDRHLRRVSHFDIGVNAWSLSKFLRLRHRGDWQAVRDGIVSVTAALEGGGGSRRVDIRDGDMPILGYVADALENECASLYGELRGR